MSGINHIGIFSYFDVSHLVDFFPPEVRDELLAMPHRFAASAVDNLILGFHRRGIRLTLFTVIWQISDCRVYHGDNITLCVSPLRHRAKLRAVDFYRKEVRNMRRQFFELPDPPQMVEAHWTYEFALAITRIPLPKFIFYRDWPPTIFGFYRNFYWFCRYLMAQKAMRIKNACYVANSTYMQKLVEDKFGKTIPVLPNPLDDDFFTSPRTGRGDNETLLFIGNSGRRKNLETLLEAMAGLRDKRPGISLRVAGIAPEEPEAVQWKNRGLAANVEFLGQIPRSKIVEELDRAAILVHPALEETFGNVLLEAMARGLPTVAGEVAGAVPEVLDHGKAGILCDVTKSESIINAVNRLLDSEECYAGFSVAGFNFSHDNFSLSRVIDRHLALYERYMYQPSK
ncbi:MAG: glycosyltransferase family 4 protein [Victivallaceae bacterium]|nr:glycosyltransferase family 4 protein [Victivallaceae bacterium]